MDDIERRHNLRHQIEIGVTVRKNGEKIPAKMINISKGGVGLISETTVSPGAKVVVTVKYIGDYSIRGTARWEKLTSGERRAQYRIGIEADYALAPENLWKAALPETGNHE